jgi:hypothetical protein
MHWIRFSLLRSCWRHIEKSIILWQSIICSDNRIGIFRILNVHTVRFLVKSNSKFSCVCIKVLICQSVKKDLISYVICEISERFIGLRVSINVSQWLASFTNESEALITIIKVVYLSVCVKRENTCKRNQLILNGNKCMFSEFWLWDLVTITLVPHLLVRA